MSNSVESDTTDGDGSLPMNLHKTSAYLVFERQSNGRERLQAIFPDTHEGVKAAITFGERNYDTFGAAEPGNEDAYLKKVHGVTIPVNPVFGDEEEEVEND